MIETKVGNLLDAEENILCQQVNCMGVMGGGLAKQIREKYPFIFDEYKKALNVKEDVLGKVLLTTIETLPTFPKIKMIASLFGQYDYGNEPNHIYTNYGALEDAMAYVAHYAESNHYSVAMPWMIGCGLGNGEWDVVEDIITFVFRNSKVTLYKLPEVC